MSLLVEILYDSQWFDIPGLNIFIDKIFFTVHRAFCKIRLSFVFFLQRHKMHVERRVGDLARGTSLCVFPLCVGGYPCSVARSRVVVDQWKLELHQWGNEILSRFYSVNSTRSWIVCHTMYGMSLPVRQIFRQEFNYFLCFRYVDI